MGRSEVLPECLFYSWAIHSTYKREAPSSVIFLRVRARSLGEVPKFFFCQRRLDSRNPSPGKRLAVTWRRQEVRRALAGMRAETLPRWSVDRHQSQKIGHRASQQVSGFAKKKRSTNRGKTASPPRRLFVVVVVVVMQVSFCHRIAFEVNNKC